MTVKQVAKIAVKVAAKHYGVDAKIIQAKNSTRQAVEPRKLAQKLTKDYCTVKDLAHSAAKIGDLIGNQAKGTVIHNLVTYQSLLDFSEAEKANYEVAKEQFKIAIFEATATPDNSKQLENVVKLAKGVQKQINEINEMINGDPIMEGWRKYKISHVLSAMDSKLGNVDKAFLV